MKITFKTHRTIECTYECEAPPDLFQYAIQAMDFSRVTQIISDAVQHEKTPVAMEPLLEVVIANSVRRV